MYTIIFTAAFIYCTNKAILSLFEAIDEYNDNQFNNYK